MTSASEWSWELTDRAEGELTELDPQLRARVVEKLDDIVDHEWRDPPEFLVPVRDSPYDKLRVGSLRLGCVVNDESRVLVVGSIRPRDSAYEGDD